MKYWRAIHFGLGHNYGNILRLCQAPDKVLKVVLFTFRSPEYINEYNSVTTSAREY